MNKDQILGIIRHILTFAGGFVVAKGLADVTSIEQVIGGLISIIGAIWSISSKTK